jgi:hypothetical protein
MLTSSGCFIHPQLATDQMCTPSKQLSTPTRGLVAELLEDDDHPFSDHFRVYDFGINSEFCALCCTASADFDGCGTSEWNAYRVWPDILQFSANVAFDENTLTGFLPCLNSIVISYLGNFCVATYRACVNDPPKVDLCNHCLRWDHPFSLESCTARGFVRYDGPPATIPWCSYCLRTGHVVNDCNGERPNLFKRMRR